MVKSKSILKLSYFFKTIKFLKNLVKILKKMKKQIIAKQRKLVNKHFAQLIFLDKLKQTNNFFNTNSETNPAQPTSLPQSKLKKIMWSNQVSLSFVTFPLFQSILHKKNTFNFLQTASINGPVQSHFERECKNVRSQNVV